MSRALANQPVSFVRWHRSGNEITLAAIAAVQLQGVELILAFDTFSDAGKIKALAHIDERTHKRCYPSITANIVDKTLIDLDLVER